MEKFKEMKLFLEELNELLQHLFQCGFSSVPETLLMQMKKISEEAKDYGLFFAAEEMKALFETLEESRHQFQTSFEEPSKRYATLVQYARIAEKQLELLYARELCHESDSASGESIS